MMKPEEFLTAFAKTKPGYFVVYFTGTSLDSSAKSNLAAREIRDFVYSLSNGTYPIAGLKGGEPACGACALMQKRVTPATKETSGTFQYRAYKLRDLGSKDISTALHRSSPRNKVLEPA